MVEVVLKQKKRERKAIVFITDYRRVCWHLETDEGEDGSIHSIKKWPRMGYGYIIKKIKKDNI